MKKQTIFILLVIFVFSLSCQFLSPAREGTIISSCADIVRAMRNIQPSDTPESLFETGIKQGDEFDANDYFNVLTHISMQSGYLLDYVYPIPDLGGSPILYPRSMDQPPYLSMKDIPENTDLADFRDHLEIEDVEQGYFEYVAMDIMAGQFYLFWHANYNDLEIVCNHEQVNDIIAERDEGSFGIPFDISQKAKARAMNNIEPLVQLTENVAIVEVIVFTKWSGFYRYIYTISRSFPHTIIEAKSENIVPYDCGVMF